MSNIDARGNELRKARHSVSGQIYLLTAVTLHRASLFGDWHLGGAVVEALRQAQEEQAARSLAWVVMPDHVHWLVELGNLSLADLMRKTKSRSAIAFAARTGRCSRIWQRGYHDRALRKEEDLKAVARYVIANPIRVGLVKSVRDYPLWDCIWI